MNRSHTEPAPAAQQPASVMTGTNPKVLCDAVDDALFLGLCESQCKVMLASGTGQHYEAILPVGSLGEGPTGTRCHMNLETVAPTLPALLKPTGFVEFDIDRVNAYLSPPGTGSPLHFDTRTIVIVQLTGRKLWMVSRSPAIQNPHRNCVVQTGDRWVDYDGVKLTVPDEFMFILLNPGDWLLIRKAVWHATHSVGGSISATLAAPAEVA